MFYVLCNALLYVMFYVTHMCDALCDLGSVTNCHLHGHLNACELMLTFFSTFMSFLSVCMS